MVIVGLTLPADESEVKSCFFTVVVSFFIAVVAEEGESSFFAVAAFCFAVVVVKFCFSPVVAFCFFVVVVVDEVNFLFAVVLDNPCFLVETFRTVDDGLASKSSQDSGPTFLNFSSAFLLY